VLRGSTVLRREEGKASPDPLDSRLALIQKCSGPGGHWNAPFAHSRRNLGENSLQVTHLVVQRGKSRENLGPGHHGWRAGC
jgi:hypothetical protein